MKAFESAIKKINSLAAIHYANRLQLAPKDMPQISEAWEAICQNNLFQEEPFKGQSRPRMAASHRKACEDMLGNFHQYTITLDCVLTPKMTIAQELTPKWVKAHDHEFHGGESPEPTSGVFYSFAGKRGGIISAPAEQCQIFHETYWSFFGNNAPAISEATGKEISLLKLVTTIEDWRGWKSPFEEGLFYFDWFYMLPSEMVTGFPTDTNGTVVVNEKSKLLKSLIGRLKDQGYPTPNCLVN